MKCLCDNNIYFELTSGPGFFIQSPKPPSIEIYYNFPNHKFYEIENEILPNEKSDLWGNINFESFRSKYTNFEIALIKFLEKNTPFFEYYKNIKKVELNFLANMKNFDHPLSQKYSEKEPMIKQLFKNFEKYLTPEHQLQLEIEEL